MGRPRVAEGLGQLRRHCASASKQQGLGHGVVRLRDGLFEASGEAVTNGEYLLHQTVSLALSHQLHTGADHRGEYALPCQVVPVVEIFENGRLLRLASYDEPVAVAKMLLVPGRRQRGRNLGNHQQVAVGCVPALANPHTPDGQREAPGSTGRLRVRGDYAFYPYAVPSVEELYVRGCSGIGRPDSPQHSQRQDCQRQSGKQGEATAAQEKRQESGCRQEEDDVEPVRSRKGRQVQPGDP